MIDGDDFALLPIEHPSVDGAAHNAAVWQDVLTRWLPPLSTTVFVTDAALPDKRQMTHLIAMCDGKRHCFMDHDLARTMRNNGWIAYYLGDWVITDAGRTAVAKGNTCD